MRCSMRTPRASCTWSRTRQCPRTRAAPRQPGAVAESAADAAVHARHGRDLRAAVCAPAAPDVRRGADTGLSHDPLLGRDSARLLRRLHLLLDHRARGPHHPEPLGGFGDPRDRDHPRHRAGIHRRGLRSGRPDGEHVPAALQERRPSRSACRRPSCVYPGICPNLNTDHAPLIRLYRRARALPGVKKVLIASGVRYDLAVESPEYVQGAGDPPYRRLSQDRARGDRRGPLVQDDEAGHRRLLQVQGAVRQGTRRRRARSSTSSRISSPRIPAPAMRTCWSSRCG